MPPAATPPLSAETKVTPAGKVSRTTTATASEGPLSVTESEYVIEPRALTPAGPDLDRKSAAKGKTTVVTRLAGAEPMLLGVSGSAVDASARATLSSVPVAGAVTVTE